MLYSLCCTFHSVKRNTSYYRHGTLFGVNTFLPFVIQLNEINFILLTYILFFFSCPFKPLAVRGGEGS